MSMPSFDTSPLVTWMDCVCVAARDEPTLRAMLQEYLLNLLIGFVSSFYSSISPLTLKFGCVSPERSFKKNLLSLIRVCATVVSDREKLARALEAARELLDPARFEEKVHERAKTDENKERDSR